MSSSYLFLDKPGNIMEWDLANPFSGYGIFIDTSLVYKFVKYYSFTGYDHHEALFLTDRESKLLDDLFSKAYEEYHRNNFSQDVLVSYAMLILAYTRTFYERQFESRSIIYNKVVADFHRQLDQYFGTGNNSSQFPTVAHFAGKANLSVNYFGDLIKHFTGQSPIEHIHQHIIQIAKKELLETKLSINEIAYGLGFEYPTYFTRFFRQKTGFSPTSFRKQ
ncbi:AraC family transcriptional regulator [Chryseobacterium pennipullorum]|uniref:AraC family transcriptional regulator n=2 Tax=Chryseobacterium pennipullorum TaxID=2258963 RepID=A0A3D9AVX3_9FLAO|nr:AraC family transcriptional regulator [Chryseobacterium pennipullorum]